MRSSFGVVWSVILCGWVVSACPCAPTSPECGSDRDCPSDFHCSDQRVCARNSAIADAGPGDGQRTDRAGTDQFATDVSGSDLAPVDAGACGVDACPAPMTCFDRGDGGHACLCHSVVCPAGSENCLADTQIDGGALRCCPPGTSIRNCGGTCIDVANNNAHCGACGNGCANGQPCTGLACACTSSDQCQNANPFPNTIGRCIAIGGVVLYDAGSGPDHLVGACNHDECVAGFADCDDAGANGCEAELNVDLANCGHCGDPAVIGYDAGSDGSFPRTSYCRSGAPSCGQNGVCPQSICVIPDGGDPAQAYCIDCLRHEDCRASNSGDVCCTGRCASFGDNFANRNCGCDPRRGGDAGVNCTAFAFDGGPASVSGARCILADGGNVSAATLRAGQCGCNADDGTQCATTASPQSPYTSLIGLCDLSHQRCIAQSASNCGRAGGVVSAGGVFVDGGRCNATLGGPLCIAINSNGRGACGCNNSIDCRIPVDGGWYGTHVAADSCNSHVCACGTSDWATNCNPSNVYASDCCSGYCTSLSSYDSCVTCDTVCETNSYCSNGSCSCTNSAGEDAGLYGSTCPSGGGGGGETCAYQSSGYSQCACASNGLHPCPTSTYCNVNGYWVVSQTGSASGCCDYTSGAWGPNRCISSDYCTEPNLPVLCTDTQANVVKATCCPAGSSCRTVGETWNSSVECAIP